MLSADGAASDPALLAPPRTGSLAIDGAGFLWPLVCPQIGV